MRVLVTSVTVWLGVVALGSGLTWLVIDQVGRGVTASPWTAGVPQVGGAEPPALSTTPSASVTGHTRRPRPRRPNPPPVEGPAQIAPSTDAGTAPGPVAPAPKRGPAPSAPGKAPSRPEADTKPTPAPAQAKTTRTWSGTGGRATVSCTGSRAALESASPADGWTVGVHNRGPEEVEVTFRQGNGGPERDVHAVCQGGSPRFTGGSDG